MSYCPTCDNIYMKEQDYFEYITQAQLVVSCLPITTMNVHNPKPRYLNDHCRVKAQNDIALEFNKQLKDGVIQVRAKLHQALLTLVDMYAAKYGLINNATTQRIKVRVVCLRTKSPHYHSHHNIYTFTSRFYLEYVFWSYNFTIVKIG